jgi:hypothetical protein
MEMRLIRIILLIALQIVLVLAPVAASSFGPTNITITIEDDFWDKYHLVNPSSTSGDVEKIYKVKKVEVLLVAGDQEFGSHTFTPEVSKSRKFNLLHGVSSALTVRIKASAAEKDVLWISSYPYKLIGNNIMIKAMPSLITVNYPGI